MRFLSRLLIVLLLPIFLTITNVRLLMMPAFPRWEYAKPGFPDPAEVARQAGRVADEQIIVPLEARQRVVDTTLAYVKGAGDESLIADMTFESGRSVYNAREVQHLTDVRVLVRQASLVHVAGGLIILLGLGYLVWVDRSREAARSLVAGAAVTAGLLGLIGAVAALAFRFFFVRFHLIFFEGDTWMFPSTDTLIQIFPQKFWFDASLLIVLLTLVEAVVIGIAALVWLRVSRRQRVDHSLASGE